MTADERSRYIDAASALIGLTIPAACRAGVDTNFALFLDHAAIVAAADDAPTREPAEALRP